jgi:hypothetical protein
MPAAYPDELRDRFARWIAAGGALAAWCRESGVSEPTARRWCRAESFRRRVATYRRPMVDRAIGRLGRDFGRATEALDERIERGPTDADRLDAARALIEGMLDARFGPTAAR